MYPYILALHSFFRWLVLLSLLYAIYIGIKGWMSKSVFTKHDDRVRHITATIVHIQFIAAICLYSISPIIRYFYAHYKEAVHDRSIRFFGMEHSLMMLIAVIVITIGSMVSKRKKTDLGKYKAMAIWYGIGLVIILVNVPWPFSPLVSRPWLRMF